MKHHPRDYARRHAAWRDKKSFCNLQLRTLIRLMEYDREIAIELLVYWSDRSKYTRDRVDTLEVEIY